MAMVMTSAKGQVVISKKEREAIGIKPRSKIIVKAVKDHIEIHPLPDDPVAYYCGIFKEGTSLTEALLRARKEKLEHKGKKGSQ
jgi:bifunctional DNA-binding transcriptional regulator/antitoxin component of YhaV-PrlF toxin-antitoxin module